MKKALCFLSVVMMSLVMVGCGNSPNGDKQKLEAPSSWVNGSYAGSGTSASTEEQERGSPEAQQVAKQEGIKPGSIVPGFFLRQQSR